MVQPLTALPTTAAAAAETEEERGEKGGGIRLQIFSHAVLFFFLLPLLEEEEGKERLLSLLSPPFLFLVHSPVAEKEGGEGSHPLLPPKLHTLTCISPKKRKRRRKGGSYDVWLRLHGFFFRENGGREEAKRCRCKGEGGGDEKAFAVV